MTILKQVFASGGSDVIIQTLELSCSAWAQSIFICNGFENHTCTTEDARTVVFEAAGIEVALPSKNTTGAQTLTFAIDNVTGQSQELIDLALDSESFIYLTLRHYLASDKTYPAENPLKFVVKGGTIEGTKVQVEASFFDMLNTAWPRRYYTSDFAPGLRYFS